MLPSPHTCMASCSCVKKRWKKVDSNPPFSITKESQKNCQSNRDMNSLSTLELAFLWFRNPKHTPANPFCFNYTDYGLQAPTYLYLPILQCLLIFKKVPNLVILIKIPKNIFDFHKLDIPPIQIDANNEVDNNVVV